MSAIELSVSHKHAPSGPTPGWQPICGKRVRSAERAIPFFGASCTLQGWQGHLAIALGHAG